MPALTRRRFLKRGSLALAVAGVVSAIPGLPMLVSATEADAPAAGSAADEAGVLNQTLVAHVKDLQSGEISLFMGEREVSYRDPKLAALLHRAAR
jgi:hypothetical protein